LADSDIYKKFMDQDNKKIKNERGVVLLLALLLIAAITATGVGFSLLIIGELKASSNIDNSIVAYYAAQNGVEHALLEVKDGRANSTLDETINGTTGVGGIVRMEGSLLPLGVAATWDTRQSTTSEDIILASVPKNKTVELDLLNPDDPAEASAVESVKFEWSDSCEGISWLEIGYVYWTPGTQISWPTDSQMVYKNIAACERGSGHYGRPCDPYIANYFSATSPEKVYRLRIKALDCDVENLSITAYDTDNAPTGDEIPIPSRVNIKSIGTYANSRIALTVSTPWLPSILGLFDYAIFSEENLDKPR
jgi:hypothetical protein